MTPEDLKRCEIELEPLVPLDGASAFARQDAAAFNANATDLREAVLDPFRQLFEKGAASPDLSACLEKSIAQLAFWRRVLVKVHAGSFRSSRTASDCLMRYLLS